MVRLIFVFICSFLSIAPTGAEIYPAKPIRLIVPFAPGGGNDLIARIIAQSLTSAWGQQVVVDNRPGGGGVIGTNLAARSTPDGYTFLLGHTGTLAINPSMQGGVEYSPINDFVPIALVGYTPLVLVTHPGVHVQTVRELISLARSKPAQLNFASGGVGTVSHLSGEMFRSMAGLDITHVAYRGTGPAVTELLGGQVQMMFSVFPSALPHIKSRRLTALAVTSTERSKTLPDLPTVAESGLPKFESVSRYGLLGPKGTPRQIVEKLSQEIGRLVKTPYIVGLLKQSAVEPTYRSALEYAKVIHQELAHWQPVVKAAGLQRN